MTSMEPSERVAANERTSLTVNECPLLAESRHWLTVKMQAGEYLGE